MVALRAECQKKINKAEAEVRSAQVDTNKTCEQRMLKPITRTQVKSTPL